MKALTPALRRRVIDALNHLSADTDYLNWTKIGMALSELGDAGHALFDQWSSTSSKYPGTTEVAASRPKRHF